MNSFFLKSSRRVVRAFFIVALLSLFLLSSYARADDGGIAVQVKAGKKVCFYEDVKDIRSRVFFHYSVNDGGMLDIMVTIQGPDGAILWMSEKGMEQRVLFKARKAGAHRFCLSNEMSTVSDKVVAFSVIVGDTDELKEGEAGPKRPRDMLQRTVHRIDQGLNEIEELQSFLRTREREHRATIEVANTRVVIWSVLEIIFIVGMAMTSMHYFRKLFSLKRVI